MTIAIHFNQIEIVKLLIGKGTNLELCDGAGSSPLSGAVHQNNLDIVKLLVENGASINTRDGYGGSPFHNAVSEKHMEILTFFMENGADMRLKTKHFRNNSIELALKGYSINILKKLIHQ